MAELTVPQVNFAPLGELGNIYKEAQKDQGLKDAFSQGVGNDPQSLAALAQKVAPYNPQMGINLAQLAHTIGRQGTQDTRQAGLDQFNQSQDRARLALAQNADARAAKAADEGVPEKAADRAKAAAAFGLTPDNPAFKPFVLTGKLPEADTSFQTTIEQRKQAALANNLDPSSPGFQSFVLTGKMPREDAQPLTAGDKEAIRTADDAVISNRAAIDSLNRAKKLSKEAFTGPTAGARGYAASFLGETSDIGKAGNATENLNNEVMTNALGQLKTIFGGNPTEGERKILLEMQGSVTKADSVRQAIFDRAIGLAQKRLEFNQQRADSLRGNTYYKPKTAGAPAQQPTQGAETALADPLGIR